MRIEEYSESSAGELVRIASSGTEQFAFVPHPLPPIWAPDLPAVQRLVAAERALGALNGLGSRLPNPHLLIRPFLRREAVASSRIEGTVTDLEELLRFEAGERTGGESADAREVDNYVQALEYALAQPPERAISAALIKELHALLLNGVRGFEHSPGQFRARQVYISGRVDEARFVPPPASEVAGLIDDLVAFIAAPSPLPELVRIALIHYQFETIHPFSDGNGRLGRLLMSLLLSRWGLLDKPLLYLSGYFERHRTEYIDGLLAVSQRGAWSDWIALCLTALAEQARDGLDRTSRLLNLRETYRATYQSGRQAGILAVIDDLFTWPITTVRQLEERLGTPRFTAQRYVTTLVDDGILVELSGRPRNRLYGARALIDILAGP